MLALALFGARSRMIFRPQSVAEVLIAPAVWAPCPPTPAPGLEPHPNTPPMKRNQVLLAGLALASPLLFAFDPTADKVAFTPAEGTSLTKTFKLSQDFALDDMSMQMNGEDMPMEMEMSMKLTQTTAVTDTYDKLAEGKPAKLTRLYKDASMEMQVESKTSAMGQNSEQDAKGEGTSKLKDKIVTFTWDADSGAYTKKYDEEAKGEDEWLPSLVEDMDLRGLLPDKEVSVDDEWTADNAIVADLFAAGGNWQWNVEMEGVDSPGGPSPEMMTDLRELLGDSLDGDVTCKFVGSKEVDGVSYLAINVTIKIGSKTDMAEFMTDQMSKAEVPEGVTIEVSKMDMDTTMEGKGTLLWDGKAGLMHSFEYEGEFTMIMDMGMDIDAFGQQMKNDMHMEMSGDMKLDVSTSK